MSPIGPEIPAHLLNRHNTGGEGHDTDPNPSVGPHIPPELLAQAQSDDEEDYVPALPPDMIASRSAGPSNSSNSTSKHLGISMLVPVTSSYDSRHYSDDEDDEDVGPKPLPSGMKHVKTDAVKEFMEKEEKRRKELEVRKYSGSAILCMKQVSGSWKTEDIEEG